MPETKIRVQHRAIGPERDGGQPAPVILEVLEECISARELIERTVREQIRLFLGRQRENREAARKTLDRHYLTNEDIAAQARRQGKVGLPRLRESETAINPDTEAERAVRAFEQGRYVILVSGRQIESLDEDLSFDDQTSVVFLRLMPLAGG